APRSQATQIPLRTGKRALCVLALDTDDRQAVGLEFDFSAENLVAEPDPGIDRRQRDRDLLLDIVDPQALERPAGDRNVGIGRDPLSIDEIAQAVVAGDVVAPGHGLVSGPAEGAG